MSYHCPYPLIHRKKIINTLNDIDVYGYMVTKRKGLGPTSNRIKKKKSTSGGRDILTLKPPIISPSSSSRASSQNVFTLHSKSYPNQETQKLVFL